MEHMIFDFKGVEIHHPTMYSFGVLMEQWRDCPSKCDLQTKLYGTPTVFWYTERSKIHTHKSSSSRFTTITTSASSSLYITIPTISTSHGRITAIGTNNHDRHSNWAVHQLLPSIWLLELLFFPHLPQVLSSHPNKSPFVPSTGNIIRQWLLIRRKSALTTPVAIVPFTLSPRKCAPPKSITL